MKFNLQHLIACSSFLLVFSLGVVNAQVDVTFTAVDESDTIPLVYITGGMNGWAKDAMFDDGTHGDMVAGDHTWSLTIAGLNPGDYTWGLASDANSWLISGSILSCTIGDDGSVSGDTSYVLSFSDIMVDVTYTLTDITKKLSDVQFSGWVNGWVYEPMYDDGTHGDETAGDHTWSLTVTHRADRDYEWGAAEGGTQWLISGSSPVLIIDSLGNVSGVAEYKYGGAEVTILAIDESDTISQVYSMGGMNGWAWDAMFDDGTNGDETAGDHIWSITYSNLPAGNYQWGLASDFSTWLISGITPEFSVDSLFNVSGITSYFLTNSDILVDVVVKIIDNTKELTDVQFTGWVNGWVYEPMYDDGTNGDETAGDHTWSLTVSHQADREYDWGAAEGGTQWLITGPNPNIVIDSLGNVSGTTTYTYGSTAIRENKEQGFLIYPNPVQSVLNIKTDYIVEQLMITNITGQEVLQIGDINEDLLQLDVDHLPGGIYLISLYGVNGKCEVVKIIKQ